jgi:hypothetical protein
MGCGLGCGISADLLAEVRDWHAAVQGMGNRRHPTGDAGANGNTPKPLLARCPAAEAQRPGTYPSLSTGPPRNGNQPRLEWVRDGSCAAVTEDGRRKLHSATAFPSLSDAFLSKGRRGGESHSRSR